ncbi:trimeric intracellular cation channel family protein [Gordonia soli]|uniref:Glycine transporter domain-containing protein n=1 Tax=Gordonia soli NBRC 108243 TaxID=1223545 RepID=M0QF14_9ACTN|nr:trimeric intracellular cation channel family protein [Gordonia soli]GAC67200.1 hypothetical protein GS4_06_00460 [Gordonia soli NBRC 108243]
MLLNSLNYIGVAVFAASGALVGVRKDLDLWGIVTVAALTGVGGGILRDVLLGSTPPAAVQNWVPVTITSVVALVVFFFHPAFTALRRTILILDAIGMGLFAATGASIAVAVHSSAFAAAVVGLLTAVGGGLLRDVLVREIPLLLQPSDLYAVPALIGSTIVAVGSTYTDIAEPVWLIVGAVSATGLRLAGLAAGWKLPPAPRRTRSA